MLEIFHSCRLVLKCICPWKWVIFLCFRILPHVFETLFRYLNQSVISVTVNYGYFTDDNVKKIKKIPYSKASAVFISSIYSSPIYSECIKCRDNYSLMIKNCTRCLSSKIHFIWTLVQTSAIFNLLLNVDWFYSQCSLSLTYQLEKIQQSKPWVFLER